MTRGFVIALIIAAEAGHGMVATVPLFRFSRTGDNTVDAPDEFPVTDTVAG